MKLIVTGGAGFIGANFLNRLVPELPEHRFVNLDALTYAANLGSLRAIESLPNYDLRRADITDMDAVANDMLLLPGGRGQPQSLAADLHSTRRRQSSVGATPTKSVS